MVLSKVEMVRQALMALGDVLPQELATFIEQQHGVRIDARFIPIIRASILDLELLEKSRQAARAATQPEEEPSEVC